MGSLRPIFIRFCLAGLLRNGAFWLPTLYLYVQATGLTFQQLLMLLTAQAISQIFFELPSGVSGDLLGRKWTLAIAGGIQAVGAYNITQADTFFGFLIGFSLLGASYAFYSGTDSAYVYDTLREFGREREYKRFEGYVLTSNFLGLGLGSFIGGILALYDQRLPMWMTTVSVGLAGVVSLTLREPRVKDELPEHHYVKHLIEASKFVSTHPRVKWLTIFSALMLSIAFISFRLLQSVLVGVGVPLSAFGTIYLIWLLMSIYAAQKAFLWEAKLGERTLFFAIPLLLFLGFMLMGTGNVALVLLGTVPLQIAYGLIPPVLNDCINRYVESTHRATVLSFKGFLQSILCAVLAPTFGWLADIVGLSASMVAMGVVCGVGGILIVTRMKSPFGAGKG